ncbi:MAG: hypothetical protein JWR07_1703 [Nevskia sp.]|nr:hypothetical protein [Nevskia sp.]
MAAPEDEPEDEPELEELEDEEPPDELEELEELDELDEPEEELEELDEPDEPPPQAANATVVSSRTVTAPRWASTLAARAGNLFCIESPESVPP